MTKDSDVNPFEEELRADSYTGHLETKEAQIDSEYWYHDPEEWWRDSSNYQRQAMLVSAGITDMNLASFEYDDLSEDIQRQLAEDSLMYSPESKANEGFTVQVKDLNGNITWQHRYDTKAEAEKARKWHEDDHGYPVSIVDSDYEGESKANEDGGYANFGSKSKENSWSVLTNASDLWFFETRDEAEDYVRGFPEGSYQINPPQLGESKASESLDYFDKKDIIDDSPMEEQLYDVLWAEHDNGDNGKDLYPSIRDDFCRGGMNIESLVSPVQSQRSKNAIASLLRWADGVFKANESKASEIGIDDWDRTGTDGVGLGKLQSYGIPVGTICPRCGSDDLTRDFSGIYYSSPADTVACKNCNKIFSITTGQDSMGESKASENFTFYEDASHGWLEVPKSLLKELGIADQISSYSYQSGDMAYLEEDADLSLFISKYGNVNTNNPQDGKHIRNYGSYVGESVAWTNASFNRKLDALESLGIKQGDAVRLASVAYEDLSEDLKKDLELPYTEEDAENEQELSAQYAEQDDVDYNNIGESRTARTKYECEHCNCGFKSNESLTIHYNQIHAVAPAPIEGYENWKDVADDLYEKEQSKRKKGGEGGFENPMTDEEWVRLEELYRDFQKWSIIQTRQEFINDATASGFDSEQAGAVYDKLKASEALDPMWFEKFAGRSGVKRIPVENFLGTIDMNPDQMSAWGNFERDASMYNWNYQTKKAISDGIVYYYNNAGESKANEDYVGKCKRCGQTKELTNTAGTWRNALSDQQYPDGNIPSPTCEDCYYDIYGEPDFVEESKANEDRVLNEDTPQNHCPECGSYKTSYDTDEKMNVCDNCGNRFEYKSSESLQSTLIKGFNNAMVMDQDDMYTCKECGQMFDIWRIEHELHRDPEEVLNDHLQGHGLQLPEGSLESHATEDYPPAPPEGKKHCPRCGGSGEIDKDIYGQSIGGIYECERCNGDGLVNESYAKEDWLDEDDDEEDYTPAVSVEEAVSILKEYPDGLTGLEWSKKVRERHGGGSASFRQAELQGLAYIIDSRTGERSTWGDKWVASESYAKEDSLVKIEDNNDDDTQVTVLDECEN